MLANGAIPMLPTAAPSEGRLAGGGDMLDRRNFAPSSATPAAENTPASTAKSRHVQQDQERADREPSPVARSPGSEPPARSSKRCLSEDHAEEGGGIDDATMRISYSSGRPIVPLFANGSKNNKQDYKETAADVGNPTTSRQSPLPKQLPVELPAASTSPTSTRSPAHSSSPASEKASHTAVSKANKVGAPSTNSPTTDDEQVETSPKATAAATLAGMGGSENNGHKCSSSSSSSFSASPPKPASSPVSTAKTPANGTEAKPLASASAAITTPSASVGDDDKPGLVGQRVDDMNEVKSDMAKNSTNRDDRDRTHDAADKTAAAMEVDGDDGGEENADEPVLSTPSPNAAELNAPKPRADGERLEFEYKNSGFGILDHGERIAEPSLMQAGGSPAENGTDQVFATEAEEKIKQPTVLTKNKVHNAARLDDADAVEDEKDPPLGEGWDEEGNDLSKIANRAIRKAHCEAWISRLRQEASALRSQDHPEVMRRSQLTIRASKRRLEMSENNAKHQRVVAQHIYKVELKNIQESYEAAMEQTRERLLCEINEDIRRSKSRMEGLKEVENRMNTRHTRGNAKASIEDPWAVVGTGGKSNINSKRPMCHVEIPLSDDEATEDIEYLRYSGYDDVANNGSSGSGGAGAAGEGYGPYGDGAPASVGCRPRRPPAWRREDQPPLKN